MSVFGKRTIISPIHLISIIKEEEMKLVKILLLFVVFCCLFFYACKQDKSYPLKQETCFIEELGEEAICGTYTVMENPYGPARREIAGRSGILYWWTCGEPGSQILYTVPPWETLTAPNRILPICTRRIMLRTAAVN
jgi:hypothetical protein